MTDFIKKNLNIVATIAVTTVVLLLVVVIQHTNVRVLPEANSMKGQEFSLHEGAYTFDITYEASTDALIKWIYSANNQEYVLSEMVLPATSGVAAVSYPVNVPISIRNESVGFVIDEEYSEAVRIDNVQIKANSFNKKGLIAIAIYLFMAAGVCVFVADNRMRNIVVYSLLTLFLFPLFMVSISALIVWVITVAVITVLVNKGKLVMGENQLIFMSFLIFAFALAEFFTTSSPLYPVNTGCDSSAYYSVGAALANGRALYTEVFDHKGPVLLFFYMIGYMLSPNYYYGVWVLETIALALDMYFTYVIGKKLINKNMGILSALIMPILLLNENYLITGSTLEIFAVPVLLYAFVMVLPYIVKERAQENVDSEENSDTCEKMKLCKVFIIMGILGAIVFWSKFSISIAWIFMAFVLWVTLLAKSEIATAIKTAIGYIIGWAIVTIPIIIYFVFNGGIKSLYHHYFVFNAQYGAVSSISLTLSRDIKNIFSAFMDNKLIFFLIALGVVVFSINIEKLNVTGKIILVGAFIMLCGTIYAGQNAYPYYFTLIAAYAVWGVFAITNALSTLSSTVNISTMKNSACVGMAVMVFIMTFTVNSMVTDSVIIDREPRVQEVIAQQMELNAKGDKTLFELGCLDRSFYAASKQYPTVQYFYLPNVSMEESPEPFSGQMSYLQNKSTEYFIWRGFNPEHYPDAQVAAENYHHVTTYKTVDDDYYMLFQRN